MSNNCHLCNVLYHFIVGSYNTAGSVPSKMSEMTEEILGMNDILNIILLLTANQLDSCMNLIQCLYFS